VSDINPGDYVDVRMVAVDVAGDRIVVRLPDQSAVHQFTIRRHQVQHTAPRSPEAIAADAVCASYGGVAPLADRAVREITRR
jgi:hypothetical protein